MKASSGSALCPTRIVTEATLPKATLAAPLGGRAGLAGTAGWSI
jgi:hypothetical protein